MKKKQLPKHGCLIEKLERAELIRDKIAHGMPWKEADARKRSTVVSLRMENAALREQFTLALDGLAEQEQQLAGLREESTLLRDEIRELKKLPKRPRMKPSGMAPSKDEDTDNSASGSSGSGRSGEAGKGRRKGRGPRRRLPHRLRRDVKVCLDDVPEGAVHKGYVDHTVRDIVFHAEEVTYRCEVWKFPGGSRNVAPLPPGVATGREQYGPGIKALVIMLYYQCQSTIRRIVSILNDVGLDISARQVGRFLTADTGGIVAEQQEVPGAGMEAASISLNISVRARRPARSMWPHSTACANGNYRGR